MREFTYRSARSGSLVVGLSLAILVESLVLHLWLGIHHPVLAWGLTAASVWALGWLAADYRALGRGMIRVELEGLDLRVGRRAALRVPLTDVATVVLPSWREVPVPRSSGHHDYRNLMKPATPNVLVTLAAPAMVSLPGGFARPARRLGLRLDDPVGFRTAIETLRSSASAPTI